MFLILRLLGKQYKIFKNLKIIVDRINLKENTLIILNNILIFNSKKFFVINYSLLNKIFITARILKHLKSKKINILKHKRRKGYKKKIGFKKKLTQIIIENINFKYFFLKYYGSKEIRRFF